MFLKEAIRTIQQSGTIAPSSRFLVKKMLSPIDFQQARCIIEFGAGDGVITQGILDRMHDDSRLISVELNEEMLKIARQNVSLDHRLSFVHGSALEFDEMIAGVDKVDYFISSLPLFYFEERVIRQLLEKVKQHLNPNGAFIQYQYSLNRYKLLKECFPHVQLHFTLLNVPPAFLYECRI